MGRRRIGAPRCGVNGSPRIHPGRDHPRDEPATVPNGATGGICDETGLLLHPQSRHFFHLSLICEVGFVSGVAPRLSMTWLL